MAAMGSAVGLGNIWRYPYKVFENGGGAFLIPYFIGLFVVGIPVMMIEFGIGHRMRQAFPGALRRISPRFSWIGWWCVSFVMFGIVVYYAVVIAWCLCYFFLAFARGWGEDPRAFFDADFLAQTEISEAFNGGSCSFGPFVWWIFGALIVIWGINWLICFFEIQKGLERATKIFMPLLIGIVLVLVALSWGFPGADNGRDFYLKPNWNLLLKPDIWIAAFTQIFFSLSLGFGIMAAYASYLPAKPNIPGSAFITCVGNCLFSFVTGFAVFNTIGFMAHETGKSVPDVIAGGPGLLFKVYPEALGMLHPFFGTVFGVLFFLMLVIAGLTSSVSIVEAFTGSILDHFRVKRGTVVSVLCVIALALGTFFCFGSGIHWLTIVDMFLNNYGLLLVVILETLIIGWFFTPKKLRAHLDITHEMQLVGWVGFVMKLMITFLLGFTWYGLAIHTVVGGEVTPIAIVGRFIALGGIFLVWLDEHWFDFDIKFVIPFILIFLLDRQLAADITKANAPGEIPWQAKLSIGVTWTLCTLAVALIIDSVVRHRIGNKS